MQWNTNINIAFGFCMGALLCTVAIGGAQSAGATFDLETLGKLSTILVVPLTFLLVAFTAVLARETRQMWVQSSLPHVIVTIEPTPVSLMYVELVVENVGFGPAFDLHVALDPELHVTSQRRQLVVSSNSILGTPTLKPKQRISSFLGGWNDIQPKQTTVTCRCKDAVGKDHVFVNVIDLSSYEGISQLGQDPLQKLSGEVEAIRKALENVANGRGRIEVNTHDADDRTAEHAEQAGQLRQFKRQHGARVKSGNEEIEL